MMMLLFRTHSGLRYLVLLAAIAATLWLVAALVRGQAFDRTARVLVAIFTGALDLQVLLGLLLLPLWPFYPALIGHITLMLLSAVAAHGLGLANKRRPEAARSNLLGLACVLVPLALVVGGILAIGRPLVGSGR